MLKIKKFTLIKTTLLTVLALLFSTAIHAANITVQTSRNPVALDDSFHLIYEADSSVDDDPDFSPVNKDFDILSSSQSTNMRSVNGSWSLKKSWDLTVIARSVGKFTLPPIKFGKDISPSIQVTVSNSTSPNNALPNGQATIPAKIFLESSIDKKSGWVQSQFVYSVRLLRTVSIAGASLTEPEITDADAITQLINEDEYQTTRNGIRYHVIERRYAIFPQKSGALKIKPVVFEGRVNATQPQSIFDQFRMSGQLKRLRSDAIDITVKPAPGNINLQDWLPAGDVQLIEEWSDDIQNLKAGEPVTRTIMIAADGLTGVQLPDLKLDDISGIKQYPDKAIIEDKKSATGIVGYKQIKVALIPAHAGNYTLPEIKLAWWNTKTDKQETATIPAAALTVTGTASSAVSPPVSPSVPPALSPLPDKTQATDTGAVKSAVENTTYWQYLSAFLTVAWLLTLILYFRKKPTISNSRSSGIGDNKNRAITLQAAISQIKKSAGKNNAESTRQALIEWARIYYGDNHITNISQIAEMSSPRLKQAIRQLNKTMYSAEQSSWQGEELLNSLDAEVEHGIDTNTEKDVKLKPLYNN